MLKTRTVGVYSIQHWQSGRWWTWSKRGQYVYIDYDTDVRKLLSDPDNILYSPHILRVIPEDAGQGRDHIRVYRGGQPDMRLKLVNEIEVY